MISTTSTTCSPNTPTGRQLNNTRVAARALFVFRGNLFDQLVGSGCRAETSED
jgi:hypothetical protein